MIGKLVDLRQRCRRRRTDLAKSIEGDQLFIGFMFCSRLLADRPRECLLQGRDRWVCRRTDLAQSEHRHETHLRSPIVQHTDQFWNRRRGSRTKDSETVSRFALNILKSLWMHLQPLVISGELDELAPRGTIVSAGHLEKCWKSARSDGPDRSCGRGVDSSIRKPVAQL